MPILEREGTPGHRQNIWGRGGVRMAERIKVPIPVFAAHHIGFDADMKQVTAWRRLCGLPKADQGVMLWMQLPREHASNIKAKIEMEIGFDDLEKEDGVDKFVPSHGGYF